VAVPDQFVISSYYRNKANDGTPVDYVKSGQEQMRAKMKAHQKRMLAVIKTNKETVDVIQENM
jgi:hypothetical protein